LFNRFYQPGIDLDTLEVTRELNLSSSADSLLAMRWIAILYNQVKLTLAATGGIHTSDDAMRLLLAGADVTHLCAALLQNGPGYIAGILAGMERWMELYEYESIEQLKGSVCRDHASDPAAYERANYIEMLKKY
jgi:dihydroorotate dehydrogenase (fumarate)